ncbi:hypothetical protein D3C80_1299650 [compost metagenome]
MQSVQRGQAVCLSRYFIKQTLGPITRPELTDVTRVTLQRAFQPMRILAQAMGHYRDKRPLHKLSKFERPADIGAQHQIRFGKTLRTGEMRATINNGDMPPQDFCDPYQRLRIMTRPKDHQSRWRRDVL